MKKATLTKKNIATLSSIARTIIKNTFDYHKNSLDNIDEMFEATDSDEIEDVIDNIEDIKQQVEEQIGEMKEFDKFFAEDLSLSDAGSKIVDQTASAIVNKVNEKLEAYEAAKLEAKAAYEAAIAAAKKQALKTMKAAQEAFVAN